MKILILSIIVVMTMSSVCFAWSNNSGKRPYEDAWGNNYKNPNNLYKDTDKDGTPNYLDYNDRNRNIQNPYQRDYQYDNNYNNNYNNRKNNRRRW